MSDIILEPMGPSGVGTKIFARPRNPNSIDGLEGDLWIHEGTGDFFVKGAVNWRALPIKLKGVKGDTGPIGSMFLAVTSPPGPTLGRDGDYAILITPGQPKILYGPRVSGAWPAGFRLDGASTLSGSGAPSNGTGFDGDYYLDTATGGFYGPKASGAWPASPTLLRSVITGSGAPSNGLGVDGQVYLDTVGAVLYGPKASGAWPAGVSLVGPIAVWQGNWDVSTTYAKDHGVSKTLTSSATAAFVSRVNGNLGNDPEVSPTQWQTLYSTPPGGLTDEEAIALAIAYGG